MDRDSFSYNGRFFTVPEVSVIPKPVQRPHPPLYQVCVTKDGIENTALRGWPMLNSVLFGPVSQLVTNRDTYVETLKKSGRRPEEIAALLGALRARGHAALPPIKALSPTGGEGRVRGHQG